MLVDKESLVRRVKVYYQHRDGGTELINYEKELQSYREAWDVIDHYPWDKELELFEEFGEGGGFFFILGDEGGKSASYQLTPIENNRGSLTLDIVSKPATFGIFGSKSVSVDFELVSIPEAKSHIKALFEYSIDSFYEKYRR